MIQWLKVSRTSGPAETNVARPAVAPYLTTISAKSILDDSATILLELLDRLGPRRSCCQPNTNTSAVK